MPRDKMDPKEDEVEKENQKSRRRKSTAKSKGEGGAKRRKKASKGPAQLDEEALKNVYTNADYSPPKTRAYETIFEGGGNLKRGNKEELTLGRNKSKRLLEPSKYWLEDPAKTKQRNKMTAKAYKGRKKFAITALEPDQEEKLIQMIQNGLTDDDEEEEDIEAKKPATFKTPKASASPKKPSRSTPRDAPPPLTPCRGTPITITPSSTRGTARKTGRRRSNLFALVPTPSGTPTASSVCASPFSAPIPSLQTPARGEQGQYPSSSGTGMLFHPGESTSHKVAGETGQEMTAEEHMRMIEEADALFGVVGKVDEEEEEDSDDEEEESSPSPRVQTKRKPQGKKRRDSVRVEVRRSMRIMRGHRGQRDEAEEEAGSCFQVQEMVIKNRRRSRMMVPVFEDVV